MSCDHRSRRARLRVLVALSVLGLLAPALRAAPLTLPEAERLAFADDPGADALRAQAAASREQAVADSQLPDPVVSIAAQNFPVDTFAFDQEPMTQLRFSVRQQIPGGDTLSRRRDLREAEAGRLDAATRLRRREVLRTVRHAWLELAGLLRERALIEEAIPLLEDLEGTALAGYRQGQGAQQGVIRARLEREGLRDRLLDNARALDLARAELARWIGPAGRQAEPEGAVALPADVLLSETETLRRVERHPAIDIHSARLREEDARVGLARAQYRPDWGVELAYGVRDQLSPLGDTPDFLSAALSFELPLFTQRRQDPGLAAAQKDREAARAFRVDALRALQRDWERERARYRRLTEREALYRSEIMPQAAQAAEAALRAYGAQATDFSEVIRAALAALDAHVALERVRYERWRTVAELRYLTADEILAEAGT
ncbi:MAG: TolC family protein [Pseudomonadales bacterium]|jgi:outer membrane protein TolC|nr:TolC family protein [Pseudomonadales bacterium]